MTSHFKLFAIEMLFDKLYGLPNLLFNLDVDHFISLVTQAESQFQSSNVGGK